MGNGIGSGSGFLHAARTLGILGMFGVTASVSALEISDSSPIVIVKGSKNRECVMAEVYLKKHLSRLSARELVMTDKETAVDGKLVIELGRTPQAQSKYGERLDKLPRGESFIIESEGNHLFLAGKTDAGTLNAAIEFLRMQCGVEEYLPGEVGTVYRKKTPIKLADIHYEFTPPYVHRLIYAAVRDKREAAGVSEWVDFHHRAKTLDFSHNLWKLLPQTKYGKSNPEFFSLVDGRRCVFTEDTGSGWQPCMTNPEGIKAVAQEIIDQFDKEPEGLSVSIGVNDGGCYCRCLTCLPLWDEKGAKFGQCGRLYYTYANKIAEIVAQKYPNRILGCLGYSSAGIPPEDLKAHKMVMPFVTLASEGQVTDELWQKNIKETIDRLSLHVTQFGVYEYIHGAGMYVPNIFNDVLARTIQYAYGKGCRAVYFESGPAWWTDVHKYALAMRLIWDPDLDVKAYEDQFIADFYGPAAEPMRRYFSICREAWGREAHTTGIAHKVESQMAWFTEKMVDDCLQALKEAFALAPDDMVAQRILMTQRAFSASAVLVQRYWAGRKAMELLQGKGQPVAAVIEMLAAVSDAGHDYDLVYRNGAGLDLCLTIDPPGDGSMRMSATFSRAKALLASRILDEVAAEARRRPDTDVTSLALLKVLDMFSAVKDTEGRNLLMLDALKTAGRVGRVPDTTTPPTLDGRLDDPAWAQAAILKDFIAYGKGGSSAFPTAVRMLRDKQNLYIGIECQQPMDKLYAATTTRDGPVWLDDSVELFFSKPGETNAERYLQIVANPVGGIFDMKDKDKNWNGEFEVKTTQQENGWLLEMRLPLSLLADCSDDGACRFNIARNKQKIRLDKTGKKFRDDYEEISSWFPSFEAHASLLSRGWILLK